MAVSLIYITFTVVFCRDFTMVSFAEANEMCAGRGVGGGNLCFEGECVVDGSHSAQVRMLFEG